MFSLKNLPIRNLKGYTGRTIAMLVFSVLMAVAIFGGTMMVNSVRQGLKTVESRLGADILVTPESAKNEFDAQTVLLQAEPGYFYMPLKKLDEIRQIEGVRAASGQMFLASASASCCAAKLQIIAFDPATDFTIQPWISDTYGASELGLMDIIVGSNVTVYDDYILQLYGNDCHVKGQFAPTGSTLDNCAYTNFDTIKVLIESSFEKGLNIYDEYDPNEVISAVMIKVAPDYDIQSVAEQIQSRVSGVSVATSKNMVAGIGDSLSAISRSVWVFAAVFWVVGLFMTILIFTMMIHERKKEFASLSAMGASRSIINGIVVKEAVTVNLAGGVIGIVLSAVVLAAFKGLIGQSLGAGFVLPPVGTVLLLAVLALVGVLAAAAVSCLAAVRSISKMDASLVLKEGE